MKTAIIGTGRMGKALLKTFYQSYPDSILFSVYPKTWEGSVRVHFFQTI